MLVAESRPRDLKWFHAGPLLYGDWGTSRLYVLGLAFLYTGHASVLYLTVIGLLMAAIAWAYTIICRCFPDGGGVYSAARHINPTLAVIGATLLLCGYIITSAISCVEAFHYFGVPDAWNVPLSILSIVLLGVVNWLGAKRAGQFSLVLALAALVVSAVMAVFALPSFVDGLKTISFKGLGPPSDIWINLTRLCLAFAGVEAVANMTGLMKRPVAKTSKRTIWPVLIEVVALNFVFGVALSGLARPVGGVPLVDKHRPDDVRLQAERAEVLALLPEAERAGFPSTLESRLELTPDQASTLDAEGLARYEALERYEDEVDEYKNAAMKVVAAETGTRWFGPTFGLILGKIAGVIFGLLLLSATNTVTMDMIAVQYAMSRDRELPAPLSRLNFSGVPTLAVVTAVVVPCVVLLLERDVARLAEYYVIGVCGAVTTNILCCAYNRRLDIKPVQRLGLWALGLFLAAISLTIAVTEPRATAFVAILVGVVLGARTLTRAGRGDGAEPLPEPITGWLAELRASEQKLRIDPDKPRVMLAARGRFQAEFAVDLARRRNATLFALFIRPIRLLDVAPDKLPTIDSDRDAQEALGSVALLGKANNVPVIPIYVVSPNIAEEILDHTVTYGCDTVILGKSRRNLLSRKLQGDVVSQVATHLPDDIALITRSGEDRHPSKLIIPEPAKAPDPNAEHDEG